MKKCANDNPLAMLWKISRLLTYLQGVFKPVFHFTAEENIWLGSRQYIRYQSNQLLDIIRSVVVWNGVEILCHTNLTGRCIFLLSAFPNFLF